MSVALASRGDVEARLGRSLTTAEQPRADGLLEEAGVIVLAYLGADAEPDPVPAAVRVVTSRMVARVLLRDAAGTPDGAESVATTTGPFARTVAFGASSSSGGPWLSATDKATLSAHRVGGGLSSVAISSGRSGRYRSLA